MKRDNNMINQVKAREDYHKIRSDSNMINQVKVREERDNMTDMPYLGSDAISFTQDSDMAAKKHLNS